MEYRETCKWIHVVVSQTQVPADKPQRQIGVYTCNSTLTYVHVHVHNYPTNMHYVYILFCCTIHAEDTIQRVIFVGCTFPEFHKMKISVKTAPTKSLHYMQVDFQVRGCGSLLISKKLIPQIIHNAITVDTKIAKNYYIYIHNI